MTKEGYSREEYEKTSEELERLRKEEEEGGTPKEQTVLKIPFLVEVSRLAPSYSVEQKLIELYKSGGEEAHELNLEYEQLKSNAQGALQALSDFERDKLGMHQDLEGERLGKTKTDLTGDEA